MSLEKISLSRNISQSTPIGPELAQRLCLANTVFYPLPIELLENVATRLTSVIGEQAVADERLMERQAREHFCAAFRYLEPIQFQLLINHTPPISVELLREINPEMGEKEVEELNLLSAHHSRYMKAYCGWLFCQSGFWKDLDAIVATENPELACLPAPRPAILHSAGFPVAEREQAANILRYKSLFSKWRLQTLATHDLPVCISPQLTGKTVYNPNAPDGAISPFIPDIFPIDGSGYLSNALNFASQSVHSSHLDSWKKVISPNSRQKKLIDTYGRQFVLQHYWRVLTQRYQNELARKTMLLDQIFAEYFQKSVDVIKDDRSKLGLLLEQPLSNR